MVGVIETFVEVTTTHKKNKTKNPTKNHKSQTRLHTLTFDRQQAGTL